jgi:hypothetical protein
LDDHIKTKVVSKYKEIRKLEMNDFNLVKNKDATLDEIEEFIRKIEVYENVDLEYEKKHA